MQTSLNIFINKTKYSVPGPTATGRALKELAGIPLTDVLFRQRPHEDEVITNDTEVKLKNGDHFHSAPPANYGQGGHGHQQVVVHINRAKYEFAQAENTGRAIKERAGIPLTDLLFRDRPHDDEVIPNDATVTLKNGDHLHSEPPANYGDVGFAGLKPERVIKQPDGWTFVVFGFTFGAAFRPSEGKVLVKLPPTFPMASPDMFWVQPALVTAAGGQPQATSSEVVLAETWQRYSWHLQPGAWRPGVSDLRDFIRCIKARFARGN